MTNLHTTHEIEPGEDGRFSPITRRERQVAELIAQGLSNERIAECLTVTPGTVANHVARILAKLGLHSRVQVAVHIASQNSLDRAGTVLALLERLRQVDAANVRAALQHATDVLAHTFGADKVDAFVYDPSAELLVTLGTSRTPLGQRQHELGLHRVPVSHGGRIAWVFQEQRPFCDGHVEEDGMELIGVRRDLGVRSTLAVPFQVTADLRGVLMVSSVRAEHFGESQLQLLQFVAYWVGLVAREHSQQGEAD